MIRKVQETWIWLRKIDESTIKSMYKTLSNDDSEPIPETVKTILVKLTDGSDKTEVDDTIMSSYKERKGKKQINIIIKIYANTTSSTGKFDIFWDAMHKILNDGSVPHERRHGTTVYKSDNIISIRHVREDTMKLLGDKGALPNIPSEEWIRLQFTPTNPRANVSSRFTQRFNMKMCLQTRLTRKYHPDQKYGCVLFKYFKAFCVLHREHTNLF